MERESRHVVVTGASRGIGRALAAAFHRRGHRVSACARRPASELGRLPGPPLPLDSPRFHYRAVDVARDAEVAAWASELLEHGPPALVVHAAAVLLPSRPLWEIPARDFDELLAIDVSGSANLARHLVPPLLRAGRGVLVFFTSGWGRVPAAGQSPYCAAKFAVEGLVGSLARELPAGLAAVLLDPGVVDTDMSRLALGARGPVGPSPERWAERAVPELLGLGPRDNGRRLVIALG